MNINIKTLLLGATVALSGGIMTSCGDDDDFTSTIFDTHEYPLDRTAYTFPLDTFLKANFQQPYNLRFIYKMEDIGSDLQKNLVPADYYHSMQLAVLAKYLWFDLYQQFGGDQFLKENSPRIIHLIGSPAYNPTSGTETLGTAEGGLKITLYKVNVLDVNDIDLMNEYFFHVMHHEFGHILDQTHQRPSTVFDVISNGHYDPLDWQNKHDSVTASWGFVTPYASEAAREDWVETLSCYLTDNEDTWNNRLATARYDWEDVDFKDVAFYFTGDEVKYLSQRGVVFMRDGEELEEMAMDNLKKKGGTFFGSDVTTTSDGFDNGSIFNYYLSKRREGIDSIGYLFPQRNGDYHVVRKVIARNANGLVQLTADGKLDFGNLDAGGSDGINGATIILQKLDLVRNWLKQYYNIDLDGMRYVLQRKQYASDSEGNLLRDSNGQYINNLTRADEDGNTLMMKLLMQVLIYGALQP